MRENRKQHRKNILAFKSLSMQNVWGCPPCLRPCLSQTIDHHSTEKEPLEIMYTTQQRQFLHNGRSIHCGKMRAVWSNHTESHSYSCFNYARKLNWLCAARNNELLSFLFCNFVLLTFLHLTWLTQAASSTVEHKRRRRWKRPIIK